MGYDNKAANLVFAALVAVGCVIGACAVVIVRWLWGMLS